MMSRHNGNEEADLVLQPGLKWYWHLGGVHSCHLFRSDFKCGAEFIHVFSVAAFAVPGEVGFEVPAC
jgi:hypothetical protein